MTFTAQLYQRFRTLQEKSYNYAPFFSLIIHYYFHFIAGYLALDTVDLLTHQKLASIWPIVLHHIAVSKKPIQAIQGVPPHRLTLDICIVFENMKISLN